MKKIIYIVIALLVISSLAFGLSQSDYLQGKYSSTTPATKTQDDDATYETIYDLKSDEIQNTNDATYETNYDLESDEIQNTNDATYDTGYDFESNEIQETAPEINAKEGDDENIMNLFYFKNDYSEEITGTEDLNIFFCIDNIDDPQIPDPFSITAQITADDSSQTMMIKDEFNIDSGVSNSCNSEYLLTTTLENLGFETDGKYKITIKVIDNNEIETDLSDNSHEFSINYIATTEVKEEEEEEPVYNNDEETTYEDDEEITYEETTYEDDEEITYEEPTYEDDEEITYEEPTYEDDEEITYEEPTYEDDEEITYEEPTYEDDDLTDINSTTDTDGDGIYDDSDYCPNEDATDYDTDKNGCIDDTDNDGIYDNIDSCPNEDASDQDSDGDGCIDEEVVTDENDNSDTSSNETDTDNDSDSTTSSNETDTDNSNTSSTTETETTTETYTYAECTHPFNDINEHWGEDYICEDYENDFINGKSSTIFSPNDDVTRAEFTKMALSAAGYNESDAQDSWWEHFEDVSPGDWYFHWTRIGEHLGLFKISTGYLNPNLPITRADAVVWLARLSGESLYGFNSIFSDISNDDPFAYAVMIAYNAGVVEGYSDGSFGPYKYISRAEAATIILRAYEAWYK